MENTLYQTQQTGFLVIGGANSLGSCAKYDVSVQKPQFLTPLNSAKCYATSARVGDKVYVAGGCAELIEPDFNVKLQQVNLPNKGCEVLDMNKNESWIKKADMSVDRIFAASAVINGKIYVTGGRTSDSDLKSCEVYDVQRNYWSSIPEMLQPRSHHTMCSLDDSLYCLGGSLESEKSCERYDVRQGKWNLISPMNAVTYGSASVQLNGKIYAIGGWGKAALESYNPVADKWEYHGEKTVNGGYHGACVINEQIYVVGGWNGLQGLSSVEGYDPKQDSWSHYFNLVKPVYGHTVVVL